VKHWKKEQSGIALYKAKGTQMMEPKTIQEALSDLLMQNESWKLANRPSNQKTVKSKWRRHWIPSQDMTAPELREDMKMTKTYPYQQFIRDLGPRSFD
jgi:hypothetical protein